MVNPFDRAWELVKEDFWHPNSKFGRCQFCHEGSVLLADMPLAMVRERIGPNNLKQFTMCDVCWFKGNEKAVKEGGTVFPFPAPNAHQDRASRGGNV
jgi:hypothetical protein